MLYLRFGSFLSNDVSSWKLVFDPLSIAREDNIWLLPCIIETTGERRMRLLVMTGRIRKRNVSMSERLLDRQLTPPAAKGARSAPRLVPGKQK